VRNTDWLATMDKKHKLRLGIVGCGAAAERCHLPAIVRQSSFELVGLVDSCLLNAERLLGKYRDLSGDGSQIKVTTRPQDLHGIVDAVIIATPHNTHQELTEAFAGMGIHCLVEKLMALSSIECKRMIETAITNNITLGVAHVRRQFPGSKWIKEVINESRIGNIEKIVWKEGAPYDWPLLSPSLFRKEISGGGVIADSGPHIIDLLLWWFGSDNVQIESCCDTSLGGAESEALVQLAINGVRIEIELSRLRFLDNSCKLYGREATIEIGLDTVAEFRWLDRAGREVATGVVPEETSAEEQWELCFVDQLENFAAAVKGETELFVTGYDGLRTVEVIQSCYKASTHVQHPWRNVVGI